VAGARGRAYGRSVADPSDRAPADLRPGVLLDVDGTLLDTNYLHVLAWWRALRDAGVEGVDMATVHRAIGIASEGLVERVVGSGGLDQPPGGGGGDVDDDLVERASDGHSAHYEGLREHVTAFPGVADLLHALAGKGLAVVLATSGAAEDLEWMQPAIGAEDAVAGATTSGDVEDAKPAPDLLSTAVEQHGLDPDRTTAVGDTVWDVESAKAAGLPCIALTCGGISREELERAGAALVLTSPRELLERLDDPAVSAVLLRG
jgi:HAD superfamily hydrolase (TIGR01509 family)